MATRNNPQNILRISNELVINNRLNCQPRRRRPEPAEPVEPAERVEPVEDPVQDQEQQQELDLLRLMGPPRLQRQHATDMAAFLHQDQDKENNNQGL